MKNKSIARADYLRVLLGLVVFFAGVLLAVLAFGSFGNVLAQARVSVPVSIKGNETPGTVHYIYGRVPMQGGTSTHFGSRPTGRRKCTNSRPQAKRVSPSSDQLMETAGHLE